MLKTATGTHLSDSKNTLKLSYSDYSLLEKPGSLSTLKLFK